MKKFLILITMMAISNLVLAQGNYATVGKIHRIDPDLDQVLDINSKIEVVAEGFTWSEGPVWVKKGNYLLFSDVPENIIHKWSEKEGLSTFLKPSGYTGTTHYSEEPGANGLIINKKGNLVSCEHGDRRIAEMPLDAPEKKKTLAHLVEEGKKLNSPNDVVQRKTGDYFFTDPPYGLPGRGKPEPAKEIEYQGVYRIDTKGNVTVQAKDMSRPNGLAFNLDESELIVAQSDPRAIIWNAYPIDKNGNLGSPRVFFDGMPLAKQGLRGAGDGMKVDSKGNIWATGPGGVLIISPAGKLLGRIETGQANSNVAFGGADGKTLFITADMNLLKLQTKVKGKGF